MAANLEGLDLELSQTHKFYEMLDSQDENRGRAGHVQMLEQQQPSRPDMDGRGIGGQLMESLDLETGYNGVMRKREQRLAQLADKYRAETDEFEEEERKIREEVTQMASERQDWLKHSIRESVAQWKQVKQGQAPS